MQDNIAQPQKLSIIGVSEEIDGFSKIDNVPMPEPEWGRLLQRQNYTQQNVVQGLNKQIILNDGTSDRMIIGYQKDGF